MKCLEMVFVLGVGFGSILTAPNAVADQEEERRERPELREDQKRPEREGLQQELLHIQQEK